MGHARLPPYPAHGLGILVVGVDTPVLDDGGGGDDALLQRRGGGTQLEGGAGGIDALCGAVEHGQAFVGHQLLIVLVEGLQVVGGVAGQCQHLAGAHLNDRRRAAPLIAVLVHHALNGLGQRFLHHLLQVDVQRQGHGAAGLGLAGVQLTGELAVLVGGDEPPAVLAVEVFLEGLLHAVLAHQVVHVVALVGVAHVAGGLVAAPFLLPYGAHGAQDVGGQLGVVHPRCRRLDGHALVVPVGDAAQQVRGHVLGEGIAAAAVQLVPDAHDQPRLRVGQALVYFVQGPQRGKGLLVGAVLGQFVVLQVFLEGLRPAGGGQAGGGARGHGQRVVPQHVLLLAQLYQPQYGVVQRRLVLAEAALVQHQCIGQAVADQHLAVAVGDDAP